MYKWNIKESRFSIPELDKNLSDDCFITVPQELYDELRLKISEGGYELFVDSGKLSVRETTKLYDQEFYDQQDLSIESRNFLKTTDWQVIRELERMYLKGTELGKLREAARLSVVHQEIQAK